MGNNRDISVELTTSPAELRAPARLGRARHWRIMLGLLSGLVGSSASAAVFINVGNPVILPERAEQKIAITISNDGPPLDLGGLALLVQVADGGPAFGGSISGPSIDGVDLLNGTPFEGKNLGGQFPAIDNTPQRQFWNVLGVGATLATGSGQLLATISFDSTGFSSGTWDLSLAFSSGATTRLVDPEGDPIDVSITNGTLTVVPEPAAGAAIIGCLLVGVSLANWAKRRPRGAGL